MKLLVFKIFFFFLTFLSSFTEEKKIKVIHTWFERKKIPIIWVLAGVVIQTNYSENCKSFSEVFLGRIFPNAIRNFWCRKKTKKTRPTKEKNNSPRNSASSLFPKPLTFVLGSEVPHRRSAKRDLSGDSQLSRGWNRPQHCGYATKRRLLA